MLVFIHMNKTGGTTVNHILRSTFGTRHCSVEPWHAKWSGRAFSNDDLQRLRRLYPNLESISGHRVVGYEDLEVERGEPKYFTVVRNPIKASASSFQHKKQISGKPESFEEWIQQDWTRNRQTKMIAGVEDVNEAIRIIEKKGIFVGLTEEFDESLVLLRGLVAPDLDISYRRVNVAPSSTIAKGLLSDARSVEILEEAQSVDMALWNHIRTEVFPGYRSQFGEEALQTALDEFQSNQSGRFREWNVAASRLKVHMVYKPLLFMSRRGFEIV